MKLFKKIVSFSLMVLMVASMFVSTTVFADTTFTNPSLYFGEDFENATVDGTLSEVEKKFAPKTSVVKQDADSNKYMSVALDDIRIGNPNTGDFPTYMTTRGGTNTLLLEFDLRIPTLGTTDGYPRMYMRRNNSAFGWLAFIGSDVYFSSGSSDKGTSGTKIDGLSVSAGEWLHFAWMNTGSGLRLYINDTLAASSNTTTYTVWAAQLYGSKCSFDVDNIKMYAFTNGDITSAVAEADKYRTIGGRATTARLDAAEAALITAENTAVQNAATATADYTNEIAKINTIIEQYEKAATYEAYKNDATLGAEVTALLSAVDDTTKSDAEIAAMFTSLDAKLEVVAFIDEVEQYITDNSSTKDTANLSYVLEKYNSDKSDSSLAQLRKVYALYETPNASVINSKTFSYDFSDADLSSSGLKAYTPASLDTVNKNYVMATDDAGIAWYASQVRDAAEINKGVVSISATLNFSSNTATYSKALMICGTDRDKPVLGLAARDDGHFYLYIDGTANAYNYSIKLGEYSANTPYDVKLVADLDNKVGEVYINGVKQATDGPVLLQDSTVKFMLSSRAGDAAYIIDNVVMAADAMKNKIAFSDKDEVTSDLTLPATSTDGYPIIWKTNNASVVAADGKVTVPASGSATAVLTADILCGEETASYSYVVNVGNTRTLYRSHRFTVSDNAVTMNVNLANVTDSAKDARSYLVVINKDTKEIVDIDAADSAVNVEKGMPGYLTNQVTIPGDGGTYLVRGFVWDSQLIPLTNIEAAPVADLN